MSISYIYHSYLQLHPKVDTPLFAATANALQLYHSPRVKILAFNATRKMRRTVYMLVAVAAVLHYQKSELIQHPLSSPMPYPLTAH